MSRNRLALVTWLALAASVGAQERPPLPRALSGPMRSGQTVEGYVAAVMGPFRVLAGEAGTLSSPSGGASDPREATRRDLLSKMRATFDAHDTDGDGRVSRAEVRARLAGPVGSPVDAASDPRLDLRVSAAMAPDANGDGYVDVAEIEAFALAQANRAGEGDLADYHALVPEDGPLTAMALFDRALAAFRARDLDGDGTLSAREASPPTADRPAP